MSGKKGIPASGEVSDKNSVSASVEEPDEKGISASGEAVDLSSDDNIGFDEYLKLVNAMFKNGYGIGIFIDADDTIQAVPIAWFKYFPNGNPIDPMGSKFGCWYPKETVKKPGDYIAKCPVVEGSAYESGFQLFAVKRLPKASECGATVGDLAKRIDAMRKNQAAGSRLTDTEVGTSRRKRIVPRAMPDEMDKPPRKRGKSTGRGGRGRGRVLRGGGLGSRVFPGDDGEYNEFADEQDEPYHSSDEEDDSVQQQQCAPRTKPATAAKPPKPSHVSNIDGKDSGLQDIGYVTKKQLAAGLLSVERPSTSAMNKTSYSNHPQSSATITMSDPLPPPVTHSHQQLPVTQHQQEPKFTWNAMQQPSGRDKAVASGSLSEDVLSSHFSGFQDSPNQPNLRQVNEKEYIETARFNEIIDLSSVMTSVGLVTNGKDDAFVAMPAYQSQTNSPGDVETGADVGFSTPIRSATNFTGNGMVGGMGANGSGSPFLEGSQRSGVSVSAGFNNFASLSRNISGPQSTGGDHYYGVTQLITNPVTGVKHTTFPSLRYEHGVVQEEPLPQGRPSRSLSRSSSGSCVAETVDCHSPSVLTPLTSPSLLRAKQVALPRARTESPPDRKRTNNVEILQGVSHLATKTDSVHTTLDCAINLVNRELAQSAAVLTNQKIVHLNLALVNENMMILHDGFVKAGLLKPTQQMSQLLPMEDFVVDDPSSYDTSIPEAMVMDYPIRTLAELIEFKKRLSVPANSDAMARCLSNKHCTKGYDIEKSAELIIKDLFHLELNWRLCWEGTSKQFIEKWSPAELAEKRRHSFKEIDAPENRIQGLIKGAIRRVFGKTGWDPALCASTVTKLLSKRFQKKDTGAHSTGGGRKQVNKSNENRSPSGCMPPPTSTVVLSVSPLASSDIAAIKVPSDSTSMTSTQIMGNDISEASSTKPFDPASYSRLFLASHNQHVEQNSNHDQQIEQNPNNQDPNNPYHNFQVSPGFSNSSMISTCESSPIPNPSAENSLPEVQDEQ